MSIKDFGEKIKGYSASGQGKDLYIVILLIVVALASFGLGRLSMASKGGNQVQLIYPRNGVGDTANALLGAQKAGISPVENKGQITPKTTGNTTSSNSIDTLEKQIVASKKGSKYYYVWCSGAKSLSEANKIYFATETEAEAKGFTKSTSCK